MASASIESSTTERLESRIARATRGRSPALVRVEIAVSAWDPWRYLERACGGRGPWFAWSSRDGNQTFIALGAVAHHEASGAEGWELSNRFCSDMCEQSVAVGFEAHQTPSGTLPLVVGGLRFSTQESSETRSPWAGWSSGALWVPELVLMERGGEGVACLTQAWSETQEVGDLADSARERARELERPPESGWLRHASRAPRRPSSEYEERVWSERVATALKAIEEGTMDKVVLARAARFSAGAGEIFDVPNTLRALRRDQPDCDVFAVGHPDGSVFLGASPEPLLETRGRRAQTVALAGTVGRAGASEEDEARVAQLLSSEKNGREHALVVDAIVEALEPLSDTLETAENAKVRTLTQVHHLETPIAATLASNVGPVDVLEGLHPTPATCGWPKAAAGAWIERHEGLDRGWYAGPVGWLNDAGDSRFCVALRSALLRGDEAHAFSGAGLVTGSTPEGEWRETEMKLQAISQSLMTRPGLENEGGA